MDIWHRVGRIVRFSNLGTLLFFTLNILLIVAVFGSSGSIVELICIYFFTVAISLSPLGEMCLAAFAGASDIKRVDIKLRVVPLVQYVLDKAKENTSYCPKKVKNELENVIRYYMSDFELPDEPTIYDFLVMSLDRKSTRLNSSH